MTSKLFSELGLSAELLKAIDRLGFEQASPIQAAAIPVLMAGKDVVGQSQTGSGKTAAFAIPAIERTDPQRRAVQVLILCPTRELAVQVAEEVHKLALFKRGVHALPIYGGQSYERQFLGLRQGAQIVIGTPGRVMDHMRRGTLRLDGVRMMVLDEADVMLDMGFREDIEFVLQALPAERQVVFFSATVPRPIQELIERFAREPETVRVTQPTVTVPTVEQVYYEVDRRFKVELLTRLIDLHDLKLGIVFCNTKRMVDDLVDHLEAQGYSADRLHGDMSQAMRDRVMTKFRKSGLEFLVATDVAARGIDVDSVEVVVNYDLPYDVEDYVHRIGRTGRAGRSGMAVSFVSGREVFQIRNIERFTNSRIQRGRVPTLAEVEEARTDVFLAKVRATLQAGDYPRQEHFIERLLEEGFSTTEIASALLFHWQGGEATGGGTEGGRSARPARRSDASPSGAADRAVSRPMADGRGPRREAVREVRVSPRAASGPAPAVPPAGPAAPAAVGGAAPAAVLPAASAPPAVPIRPAPEPASSRRAASGVEQARAEGESAVRGEGSVSLRGEAKGRREPRGAEVVRTPPWLKGPKAGVERVRQAPAGPAKAAPKASRRTPSHQTRLFMNVGLEMGVKPMDIVELVMGHTGLPAKVVGTVDLRERHLFVDVDTEQAPGIVSKLNRAYFRDRKLKVKTTAGTES